MRYLAKHTDPIKQSADCLIIGVFTENHLSAVAKDIDKHSKQYLSQLLQHGELGEECGQTLLLQQVPGIAAQRVLLINCGKQEEFNADVFRKVTVKAIQALKQTNITEAISYLPDLIVKDRDIAWKVRQTIENTAEVLYVFVQFKSQKKPAAKLKSLILNIAKSDDLKTAEHAAQQGSAIVSALQLTKDLANTPANVCTPTYLAKQAQSLSKKSAALKVDVLEEKDMQKLNMGALLSVTRGSHEPAKLIVLKYNGAGKTKKPTVLVGKGVTFDSGGLSLKTSHGMEEMKFDMCGAATVLGVMQAVVELKLKINLIGVIPATENMPGGNASKVGDIVTTLSGQTVEIMNTDAEGRLILCDALSYCERFEPETVIDIATLTGGIIITLGYLVSGLFGNHEPLMQDLQTAGDISGDKVWPLPIWEEFQELINSPAADMMNVGPNAKSITAACFLARFTKKFHWAHLDVAGTAVKDKWATGRPVRLLMQYLLNKH